jgi:hypothetical protein
VRERHAGTSRGNVKDVHVRDGKHTGNGEWGWERGTGNGEWGWEWCYLLPAACLTAEAWRGQRNVSVGVGAVRSLPSAVVGDE